MPIPSAFRKSRGVASLEKRLAVILDQHELALEQKDELILVRVPMTLTRPLAGWQTGEVHTEVRQAARIAQPLAEAIRAEHREGLRISHALPRWHAGRINFRHGSTPHSRDCNTADFMTATHPLQSIRTFASMPVFAPALPLGAALDKRPEPGLPAVGAAQAGAIGLVSQKTPGSEIHGVEIAELDEIAGGVTVSR